MLTGEALPVAKGPGDTVVSVSLSLSLYLSLSLSLSRALTHTHTHTHAHTVGNSSVDEAMLTGEALPVAKGPGDTVVSVSLSLSLYLSLRLIPVTPD